MWTAHHTILTIMYSNESDVCVFLFSFAHIHCCCYHDSILMHFIAHWRHHKKAREIRIERKQSKKKKSLKFRKAEKGTSQKHKMKKKLVFVFRVVWNQANCLEFALLRYFRRLCCVYIQCLCVMCCQIAFSIQQFKIKYSFFFNFLLLFFLASNLNWVSKFK